MNVLVVNRNQVAQLLTMAECIEVVAKAMAASARGEALQPLRRILQLPGGNLLGTMPGYLSDPRCFGVKAVSVYPGNFDSELPSHQAFVLLFEAQHGSPLALVDGGEITAIRTAAASGLATRLLARKEASTLAILGYGEQAGTHLRAMRQVRDLRQVRVWGRSMAKAQRFAEIEGERNGVAIDIAASAEEAVTGADIICTTTAAPKPILKGAWLSEGTHLNVVGSSVPSTQEIDTEAVARSRFFVDLKESTINQGGEYLVARREGAIDEEHIQGEIGEVLIGRKEGRRSEQEITLYKSLGVIVQDLAAAYFVYEKARRAGLGTELEL